MRRDRHPDFLKAQAVAYFEAGVSASETHLLLSGRLSRSFMRTYYAKWTQLKYLKRL